MPSAWHTSPVAEGLGPKMGSANVGQANMVEMNLSPCLLYVSAVFEFTQMNNSIKTLIIPPNVSLLRPPK